jgi:hypothetical protein
MGFGTGNGSEETRRTAADNDKTIDRSQQRVI